MKVIHIQDCNHCPYFDCTCGYFTVWKCRKTDRMFKPYFNAMTFAEKEEFNSFPGQEFGPPDWCPLEENPT